MSENNTEKKCCRCKKIKNITEFHKDKSIIDGYSRKCKECCSLKHFNNRDYYLSMQRKYTENNRKKLKEKDRRYYLKNRDLINKKQRAKYKNRTKEEREHEKERKAKYRNNNRELIRELCRRRRSAKRRINERYSIADEQYTKTIFNYQCFNCGSKENLCIDHHFPLFRGNPLTRQNAVVLCNSCNSSKGKKLPKNFYTKEQLTDLEENYAIQKFPKETTKSKRILQGEERESSGVLQKAL